MIPKVSRGQPVRGSLNADNWNAFVDAANYVKLRQYPSSITGAEGGEYPFNTVLVRNDSGADRTVGEVLALNGPVITPSENAVTFKTRIGFKGIVPTTSHWGKFAVLAESIPSGKIGLGVLTGVVQTQVNITHTWMARCDVTNNDATKLTSAPHGTGQILWAESGTGTKWAIVRLGVMRDALVIGKASSTITANSTNASVEVWNGGSATGYTISGVYFNWMTGGENISSGKQVACTWFADEKLWRITGAECET